MYSSSEFKLLPVSSNVNVQPSLVIFYVQYLESLTVLVVLFSELDIIVIITIRLAGW
jgi:hypothetical protein